MAGKCSQNYTVQSQLLSMTGGQGLTGKLADDKVTHFFAVAPRLAGPDEMAGKCSQNYTAQSQLLSMTGGQGLTGQLVDDE